MAFTYATLKTAIQDYTQNEETTFVSQLNTFIINSEERILKEVQLSVFRKNSEGSTSAGNQFLSKPTDFLAPYSLSVKNGVIITQIAQAQECHRITLTGMILLFYYLHLLPDLMMSSFITFTVLNL